MLFQSKKTRFLKYFGQYIIKTSQTIFNVSVITFIVYLMLENFKIGLISNYFDMNILLVLAIVSGLLVILFNEKIDGFKPKKGAYLFSFIFAIVVALFSYQYLQSLGKISLFISLLSAVIIFIIINLFYQRTYD